MRREWWLLVGIALACASACSATLRSTTEYDPAALALADQWSGIFWTVAVIGATIFGSVWVVCYYRNERERRR